ncbi:MAG: hypothetical protein H6738_11175 [Alphaproteobacteria bacterium]|nr:hypothetical protein [Alphaproteobacteria bacterium]MCB9697331.1 hypothetical protein [Alphaproteobacteria bacterium]
MVHLADIPPLLLVLAGSLLLQAAVTQRFQPWERPLLWLSMGAHVVSTFALMYLVFWVYGVGDMMMYHQTGIELSAALWDDFTGVFPEVLKILTQQRYALTVFVPAAGSSTGSMCAFAGLAAFPLNDSLAAIGLFYAMVAYFGKVMLYEALRRSFAPEHARWILIAVLLVPSTVFWSSGLVKEAIAMGGVGPFVYGMVMILERRRGPVGLFWMVVGGFFVAMVKPYILLVLLGAAGVAFYWKRSVERGVVEFRPLMLVLGAAVVIVGVLVVGQVSPRFSIDRLAEETGRMQSAGSSTSARGGSMYQIGTGSRSLSGQLLYAPLGLLTALYRPILLDVRNPQMLINAVETTMFLFASFAILSRQSARTLWESVVRYPILAFCVPFVLVLGIATGLTSANLGTLSRYRMPIVPFFAAVLVVWWYLPHEVRSRVRPRPATPGQPRLVPDAVLARPAPSNGRPRT